MVSKLISVLRSGVTFVSLLLSLLHSLPLLPVLAFGSRSGWSTLILHPLPWSSGLGGGFQACGHFSFLLSFSILDHIFPFWVALPLTCVSPIVLLTLAYMWARSEDFVFSSLIVPSLLLDSGAKNGENFMDFCLSEAKELVFILVLPSANSEGIDSGTDGANS